MFNYKLTDVGKRQLADYYKNKQAEATKKSLSDLKIKIEKRLAQLEKELEKNNTLYADNIGSSAYLKKERKRDYLAMEKFKLKQELEKIIFHLVFVAEIGGIVENNTHLHAADFINKDPALNGNTHNIKLRLK